MQQQVAVGAVDVQRLGAVFAAARLLPSPHQVPERSVPRGSLSRTGGRRLGEDAVGEPHRVRDDGVAALQRVPGGGGGGFGRGGGGAAGQGGGGAGGGEVWQRGPSTGGFRPLGQI